MTEHVPGPLLTGLVPPATGLVSAILERLAVSPQLNTSVARRDMLWRVTRHHSDIRRHIDESAPLQSQIGQLLRECADQPQRAETLAEVIEEATQDPVAAAPLRILADWMVAQRWLEVRELDELRKLVIPVAADRALAAARVCLPPASADLPAHCTGAWATLLHLLRRNVLPNGLPPFLAFLEYLAASSTAHRTDLQRWTAGKAEEWALSEELQECRAAARSYDACGEQSPTTAQIMLALIPDGLHEDRYTLQMWHREGSDDTAPVLRDEDARAIAREDLPSAVRHQLRRWLTQPIHEAKNPSIEFWLPLALINEPVWEWLSDVGTPVTDGAVVVRSLDRLGMAAIDSAWRARWHGRVNDATKQQQAGPRQPTAASTELPPTLPPSQLPVILRTPPDDQLGRGQLLAALRDGAPAILWHRHDCSADFLATARQLIDEGPLSELPSRLDALRAGTLSSHARSETARDITMVWEDTQTSLPLAQSLVAPAEAGS